MSRYYFKIKTVDGIKQNVELTAPTLHAAWNRVFTWAVIADLWVLDDCKITLYKIEPEVKKYVR